MATVAESITWSSHGAQLKNYLDIAGTDEDTRLELWLESAASAADHYIGTRVRPDEVAKDPTAPWGPRSLYNGTPPAEVALGCFEWVKAARATYGRTFGLTSVRTGDLSESYAFESRITGGIVGAAKFTKAASGYWWQYKRYITL